jgi:hypothetical protein
MSVECLQQLSSHKKLRQKKLWQLYISCSTKKLFLTFIALLNNSTPIQL